MSRAAAGTAPVEAGPPPLSQTVWVTLLTADAHSPAGTRPAAAETSAADWLTGYTPLERKICQPLFTVPWGVLWRPPPKRFAHACSAGNALPASRWSLLDRRGCPASASAHHARDRGQPHPRSPLPFPLPPLYPCGSSAPAPPSFFPLVLARVCAPQLRAHHGRASGPRLLWPV